MQLSLDWMQALSSITVIVATIIGGVWAVVSLKITASLDKFKAALIAELNGTYIRRGECGLMRETEHQQYSDLARRVDRMEQVG